MSLRLRLILIIPGAVFLVGIVSFEFGFRMGREHGAKPQPSPEGAEHSPQLTELSSDSEFSNFLRQDDSELIRILLAQDLSSRKFSFPMVIQAATETTILPFDDSDPLQARIAESIALHANSALSVMSGEESPLPIDLRRINEASRFFEESLRAALDAEPGLNCSVPETQNGKSQRSGYPDLRIDHPATGTVLYLDIKLFEESNRESTLRTFYYTPRRETSKITANAHHLLLGISHDGMDGDWTFTNWELIDLAKLEVKLKAEFQASNREIYRDDTLVRRFQPGS